MPMEDHLYHTLKGYEILETRKITYAMEDYLEMLCRLSGNGGAVRIGELARALQVKPSSATKMIANLKKAGLVFFEPYGLIRLSKEGVRLGNFLIRRHQLVHDFLCMLNQSEDELQLTEKIEHYLDQRTLASMERWLREKRQD